MEEYTDTEIMWWIEKQLSYAQDIDCIECGCSVFIGGNVVISQELLLKMLKDFKNGDLK